jgi:hypothetical protein
LKNGFITLFVTANNKSNFESNFVQTHPNLLKSLQILQNSSKHDLKITIIRYITNVSASTCRTSNGAFAPKPQIILENKDCKRQNMKKKMTIKITPEQKMRITTDEEMQMFLHMKRKGSSMTKNGKAYRRREKHHKPNY